jgi:hypothetical protein
MTIDRGARLGETPEPDDDTAGVWAVTGRMVNLRFLKGALRRRWRVWLGCALAGLVVGAGYHAVVPVKYTATATLYLAHAPDSDNTVVAQNDLAMLDTAAVGDRALAILGMKGVTGTKFLGKQPGTTQSDNVLTISMTGPSATEAVRRVDAVAKAYLEFRAKQYRAQNAAVVAAAGQQANDLRTRINQLNTEIAGLHGAGGSQLTTLVAERATATTELTTLQQSIQQDDLATLSVIHGSRVITPGTAVTTSKKKVFALDGLTGLAGGLGLGIFLVVAQAALSDRIRRREDLAAVLGAPVVVSVGPVKRPFGARRRSLLGLATGSDRQIATVARYFRDLSVESGGAPVMVVAADDRLVPAAAVLAAAGTLVADDRRVVVVDATEDRVVASHLGVRAPGRLPVEIRTGCCVTLLVPSMPWEEAADGVSEPNLTELLAHTVLVIASCGPSNGAWRLRTWARHAVVTVSSGASTVSRISTLGELLDAAGIGVVGTVLLDADPLDDSPGLPVPGAPVGGRRLGVVRTSTSMAP